MSKRSRDFLRNFDIDGDETFSLEEFVLFLVLLSMPLKDMQSIFVLMDADGSGELDKQEFISAVEGLVSLTGHAHGASVGRGRLDPASSPECAALALCSALQ
jgi:calcium uptake protein 1, mitochondrial